ncbi:MAG: helix-turn-helix transcriptional regulator [Nitrospirae bacterium]|nr:helix-turn-helix transcriptional regulator [Nitrospirota bacterium]
MKTKQYRNTVGENIRKIRQERDLTQEELALMSRLSQGYINQLESGKRKFTQKTLTVIAEALNLPLYVFFKEEGEEQKILEKAETYAKRPLAREVFKVFKALPPHIADHYMTLMSIEKDLYEKKKKLTNIYTISSR